ncbi:MAG: HU family DNA-binding protein [Bacteroidales bacterium]|jgi:predicted histone-like DNA-binding protein|nr:HU family DNA-binding protein [Bacteroidales bacterium]
MAIKYVLSEKSNPMDPEQPKKWYAHAKSAGDITLKALGKEITQRSTVNHADTLAVLEALTQLLTEKLAEGKIVRFGDLGSFQISIGSEGAETEENFNSSMIKTKKVSFRPGIDLKEMLNNLKFEKY